tara:strand:+ start:425 stop:628 length:204 start_codon:yes stop_codon:yes gene_type:complete
MAHGTMSEKQKKFIKSKKGLGDDSMTDLEMDQLIRSMEAFDDSGSISTKDRKESQYKSFKNKMKKSK